MNLNNEFIDNIYISALISCYAPLFLFTAIESKIWFCDILKSSIRNFFLWMMRILFWVNLMLVIIYFLQRHIINGGTKQRNEQPAARLSKYICGATYIIIIILCISQICLIFLSFLKRRLFFSDNCPPKPQSTIYIFIIFNSIFPISIISLPANYILFILASLFVLCFLIKIILILLFNIISKIFCGSLALYLLLRIVFYPLIDLTDIDDYIKIGSEINTHFDIAVFARIGLRFIFPHMLVAGIGLLLARKYCLLINSYGNRIFHIYTIYIYI